MGVSEDSPRRRLAECVARWPAAAEGEYDPRCCRFPKSCSADVYDEDRVTDADLEPEPLMAEVGLGCLEHTRTIMGRGGVAPIPAERPSVHARYAPTGARAPAGYDVTRVPGVYACHTCGGVVADTHTRTHDEWHERLRRALREANHQGSGSPSGQDSPA